MVVRQVSGEEPELSASFVEDVCPDESTPLEGVQDNGCKGFVNQNGLAKVAVKLIGPYNPVVIEFLMQQECRLVGG